MSKSARLKYISRNTMFSHRCINLCHYNKFNKWLQHCARSHPMYIGVYDTSLHTKYVPDTLELINHCNSHLQVCRDTQNRVSILWSWYFCQNNSIKSTPWNYRQTPELKEKSFFALCLSFLITVIWYNLVVWLLPYFNLLPLQRWTFAICHLKRVLIWLGLLQYYLYIELEQK